MSRLSRNHWSWSQYGMSTSRTSLILPNLFSELFVDGVADYADLVRDVLVGSVLLFGEVGQKAPQSFGINGRVLKPGRPFPAHAGNDIGRRDGTAALEAQLALGRL